MRTGGFPWLYQQQNAAYSMTTAASAMPNSAAGPQQPSTKYQNFKANFANPSQAE